MVAKGDVSHRAKQHAMVRSGQCATGPASADPRADNGLVPVIRIGKLAPNGGSPLMCSV